MLWVVEFRFTDNNGREAQSVLRLPAALSYLAASARALDFAALLQPLTNARLDEVKVSRTLAGPAGSIAEALSSVTATAVLFYTDGTATASFRVPSILPELFETEGPYEGMRITRESADDAALLGVLDSMLDFAVDPAGRPYPEDFMVGGRDHL